MNTLDSTQVAIVLDRLYLDAADTSATFRARIAGMSDEERQRWLADGHALYTELAQVHLPVSRETGRALYLLARASKARSIVEFGTSFGLSTIHLAAALRDNGGGRLVTTELLESKAEAARANLDAAGLADLVEVRVGDALETLAEDLPSEIDLLLLDGHKPLYRPILDLVLPRVRVGASVVADNADAAPDYLAWVRAWSGKFASVPWAGDVEWSLRTE